MPIIPKIIGVGLPHTGGSVLAEALGVLGVGHVEQRPELPMQRYRKSGRWDMGKLDAVYDINPWALPAIRRAYPGAMLIHTITPLNEWVESWVGCQVDDTRHLLEVFGVGRICRPVFEDTYKRHGAYISEFFQNDSGPHTALNVCDGWPPLCNALGIPAPVQSFPHTNQQGVRPWTPNAYNG